MSALVNPQNVSVVRTSQKVDLMTGKQRTFIGNFSVTGRSSAIVEASSEEDAKQKFEALMDTDEFGVDLEVADCIDLDYISEIKNMKPRQLIASEEDAVPNVYVSQREVIVALLEKAKEWADTASDAVNQCGTTASAETFKKQVDDCLASFEEQPSSTTISSNP
ncbi:hypothetical protein ACQU0X_25890 [Pseudovibrio ascidiaceicola]|uniref:hypothetical protein n=1 Tax=Pseudovibrio ascidiaceicola TaxID=285279 RepID=UPI003D3653DC